MSEYTLTKVKDEKIEGHVVEFKVDTDGIWYASCAVLKGSSAGKTISEAKSRITTRLRRETVKLEIHATIVNALPDSELDKSYYSRDATRKANGLRHIILTGFSQRDGDVMYRFDDDGEKANRKKSSHQTHADPDSIGVVCRRLSNVEVKEYRSLRDAFDVARDELATWITLHKIEDVSDFLEEKIQEKIDTPDEPESEPDVRDVAPRRKK